MTNQTVVEMERDRLVVAVAAVGTGFAVHADKDSSIAVGNPMVAECIVVGSDRKTRAA